MTPTEHAAHPFFALHQPGDPFVLPCVWDIASAKLLTSHGFSAIGTTSFGVASTHGTADESRTTRSPTLALVAAIRAATPDSTLLTCDIEDGFSNDPRDVAATVRELDVHGINIEDSILGELIEPAQHAQKIEAIKQDVPDVFVNARVDTYWTGLNDPTETRRRIDHYVDAGADGIFVPGDLNLSDIARITAACPAPVNVLASGRHTRAQLAEAGVARISSGSLLYRAALTTALEAAQSIARDKPDTAGILGYDRL